MSSDILLKKGELSSRFRETFAGYYTSVVDNKAYAEHQLPGPQQHSRDPPE